MAYRCGVSLISLAVALILSLASNPAQTQPYPSETIKIIISQAPGGLMDLLPRILGHQITAETRQPVLVESRVGGNGALAGAELARAKPDGYTLMMGFHGVYAMLPHMTKLSFDPIKAFQPVVHLLTVPNILVVDPSLPIYSLSDLIAYARANPGKFTFASQGPGSAGHVAGELLKQMAGIDIVHVPYRGAAPAQQAVMAGHVGFMFDVVTLAISPVKAGKLRALAVTSPHRVEVLKDVPTFAESGMDLEMSGWFGLVAPAGTPRDVVTWLNKKANETFSAPEIRARFLSQGASLPLGPPEAFEEYIKAENKKWGPIIRRANIHLD
jgi:tripartite-type tricarboxylate transporter receptor subunit TctC